MTTATRKALKPDFYPVGDPFESHGFPCKIERDRAGGPTPYPMTVDQQIIGYARTEADALITIDTYCDELSRNTRATTADMEAERATAIDEELAAQELRLADEDEAGYYVLVTGGKHVWATDDPPRQGNPVSAPIFEEEAPPTRDDLAVALDRAVTARIPIPRDTPEWHAAQVEVDRAHEALDPVGYRAAKKSAMPQPVCPCNGAGCPCCDPSHPEAPEREWEEEEAERDAETALCDCGNRAVHVSTLSAWCQECTDMVMADTPPYATLSDDPEGANEREMRDGLDAEHAADETDLDRVRYNKGAGTGGDPTLVVAVPVDDPCADVRRALAGLLAALESDERMGALARDIDAKPGKPARPIVGAALRAEIAAAHAALKG